MSENLHDIDKLFRDAIEGQEEMPPPGVWNELDQKLDKRKVASIADKYNKLKWVAAALFLVSTGLAMYVYRVNRTVAVVKNDKEQHRTAGGLPSALPSSPLTVQHQPAASSAIPSGNPPVLQKKNGDSQLVTSTTQVPPSAQGIGVTASAAGTSGKHIPVPLSTGKDNGQVTAGGASKTNHNTTAVSVADGARPRAGQAMGIGSKNHSIKDTPLTVSAKKQPDSGSEPNSVASRSTAEPLVRSHEIEWARVDQGINNNVLQPFPLADKMPPFTLHNPLYDLLASGSSVAATIRLAASQVPRVTATFFYSPNASTTHVTNNSFTAPRMAPNSPNEDSKAIKDKESNGHSWSLGANLDFRLNSQWTVGTGLILSTRVTYIRPSPLYGDRDQYGAVKYQFNCSSGYSIIELKGGGQSGGGPTGNPAAGRDTAKSFSSASRLQYLSVPLIMKYHFGQGRLRFNTGFGLQTNILVNRKLETYITKGSRVEFANTSEIQGLRSVYLSGILSASASYSLNRTLSLTVTPNAQMAVMSINQYAPVKSYINFYGVAAGLSIKL